MDREKLGYAISAIWALAAIPLSELVFEEAFRSGLFMRVFSYLLVLAPVWLVFGWRWLTNKSPISRKFWIGISLATSLLAFFLGQSRYLDDVTPIPLFSLAAFLTLVWNYERTRMLRRPLSTTSSPTSNGEAESRAQELVKLSNELSGELERELRRLAPNLRLVIPIHTTEAILSAYSLVYLNWIQTTPKNNRKIDTAFAAYKRLAMSAYADAAQPKIPGAASLSETKLKQSSIQEPIRELFKAREGEAQTGADNLRRNTTHPLYPLYASLRPFIGKDAAIVTLNEEFSSLFLQLNGRAKRGIERLLNAETDN